jgi:predicted heme/steroid binding protein
MDEEDLARLPMMTVKELSQYRGIQSNDFIYFAVDGKVFDVTISKGFYGPGGA